MLEITPKPTQARPKTHIKAQYGKQNMMPPIPPLYIAYKSGSKQWRSSTVTGVCSLHSSWPSSVPK
ncbi:hypothetical protein BCR34DRAFT_382672 [Clohesyomyces aquaticus]|uniref:Uncharacterized protein n=1 Tax=Clohesyomyces aquaticus TaxID=1231657 RepID=A0A1Y1ZFX4_9PLEO|nr:hypothetical protein BCR34DRAFT_382672 [Clohesyomyces aquaticus]